jgi:hypothetical protein
MYSLTNETTRQDASNIEPGLNISRSKLPMSTANTTTTPQPVNYDTDRTETDCEIERLNESLTRFWRENGTSEEEQREFRIAKRTVSELAGDDDLAGDYLLLTLLKDWYRALHGRRWGL